MADPSVDNDPEIAILRCKECGRRLHCRESEMLAYAANETWPRCCNEIMRLYGRDKGSGEWTPLKDS